MPAVPRRFSRLRSLTTSRIFGVLCLFSGAALLVQILVGIPLLVGLALAGAAAAVIFGFVWKSATPSQRLRFLRFFKVGLFAGIVATAIYDLAKLVLSQLDASPYNPFEAIRIFGVLIVGSGSPESLVLAAGASYHVLNGITFAVAFCLLFGPRGVVAGILWALFLEVFQVLLYPSWLNIEMLREFVQISFLGHVAYGASLGFICRNRLRRYAAISSES